MQMPNFGTKADAAPIFGRGPDAITRHDDALRPQRVRLGRRDTRLYDLELVEAYAQHRLEMAGAR